MGTEEQSTNGGGVATASDTLTVTDNRTGRTYEIPIAQLSFMALDAPAEHPYGSPELGSHYQGQTAATESRYGRAVR